VAQKARWRYESTPGIDHHSTSRQRASNGRVKYSGLHPTGATGARIVMTLAYELRRRGGGIGVCGICPGHAQGDAMLIKVEK